MKRKLLSVLLTFCLAFSLLPTAALAEGPAETWADAVTEQPVGYGIDETNKTLTISSAEGLAWFAKQINSVSEKQTADAGFKGYTINITEDIDLSGKLWIPIDPETVKPDGRTDRADTFNNKLLNDATINGNDKKIIGMTVKTSVRGPRENSNPGDGQNAYYYAGFIGRSTGELTIKNITFEGAYVSAENEPYVKNNGSSSLAVVCGYNGGTLTCTNVDIKNCSVTAAQKAGGFVGQDGGSLTLNTCSVVGSTFNAEWFAAPIDAYAMGTQYNNNPDATGNRIQINGVKLENNTVSENRAEGVVYDIPYGNGGVYSNAYESSGIDWYLNWCDTAFIAQGRNNTDESGKTWRCFPLEFVAKVNGYQYETLADAITAADENATVTLLKDVTTNVTIPAGKTVTLDLNGHTLVDSATAQDKAVAEASRKHTITNNGTLTILDSVGTGVVDNLSHGRAAIYNAGTIAEIKSGKFTSSADASVSSEDDGGNSWYVMYNAEGATISKISGGEFLAIGKYSSLFCNCGSISEISGGTFTQDGFIAFKNTGTVDKISGGTFSSKKESCIQNWGSIGEITGGTITAGSIGIWNFSSDKYSSVGKVGKISGGNISGSTAAIRLNDYDTTYLGTPSTTNKASVAVSGGNISGNLQINTHTKFTVSGGYFTSDPTAYLAAGKYVIKSDKAGYTYAVTGTEPEKTPIFVDENTTHDTSAITDETTKNAIDAVINKAKVEGVAAAVDESALVASKVDANEVNAAKKVDVEVSVKVEVKSADLSGENAAKTLTFEAKPVATIKVDGTVKATNVAVPNSLLSGAITVKLPLPAGFTPEQIKHISSDGSVEYFLRTAKRGAKPFEIKDGCAVFTITKFSTFELSGTVTYVEPSYSSGSSYDPTYSVTVDKTENGSVTVSPKSASKGDTVTVTVKPDSGYVLETLTVTDKNGNELTLKDKGNGKYTFTMPAGKVEVKATFMEDNSMLNFFYDVPNNAYFYEAVKWAVKNGITTGVGDNLFAPEQPCTRAQIVTFLWRAAGSPEPKGAASGMTDVVSGSYYEKAVAWAIENGITTGTTTSTFSPDATCTRAQAVTFLARALSAKAASAAEFSDVPTDSYFADAVAWAAANGVTEGIGGGLFGSDNDCTRGQIVTFLYRAYNK